MVEKGRSIELRKRCFRYAIEIIKLFEEIEDSRSRSGSIIGKQLLRSATSVGANIEEAQSGESKADFIHKYCIAQKEARESLYWLRLLAGAEILPKERLEGLGQETNEIIAVLATIIKNTKSTQ